MYRHLLFATDLSSEACYIVKKSQEMRQLTGATLDIVHVVELPPAYGYAYAGIEEIEEQLIQEAKTGLARLGQQLNVDLHHQHVERGPTKIKIHDTAKKIGADLIIVGSHGRHGLSLLLGSTANAVLHGASCDVWVIRLPE